jgi:hypothetical protein
MINELEKISKEAGVGYLKVLCRPSSGKKNRENHGKFTQVSWCPSQESIAYPAITSSDSCRYIKQLDSVLRSGLNQNTSLNGRMDHVVNTKTADVSWNTARSRQNNRITSGVQEENEGSKRDLTTPHKTGAILGRYESKLNLPDNFQCITVT